MKEKGTVTGIGKDTATIEITSHEECHKCGLCRGTRDNKITVSGDNAKGLSEGDAVEVEVSSSSMMSMYCFLYGLPLVVFVGVMLTLYAALQSPILSFAGGGIGTIVVYLVLGFYIRRGRIFAPEVTVTKI